MNMAICGFRADCFSFGLLEGGGFRSVLSLLEKAEKGFPEDEVAPEWAEIVEASIRAGYLDVREKRILLQPAGQRLLGCVRSLFSKIPPPR